jgi:tRNA(Arg) A34 adenosine deaminase TadA
VRSNAIPTDPSSSVETAGLAFRVVDHIDVAHLRRCLELARAARDSGNEPFGSLLVGGDGTVRAELMNTISTGDITGHPELALAAWASLHMTTDERAAATLYTSCESCAMCAGGQYWAGIGRLVFALSGAQLSDIAPDGVPRLRLSSREVFARGDVAIDVDGPCDELAVEAVAVFAGMWSSP